MDFRTFSEGIEIEHWPEMGQYKHRNIKTQGITTVISLLY